MATIYINDISSSSTSLTNGQPIEQSSTYTIIVSGNYSTTLRASVTFYNGTNWMIDMDNSMSGRAAKESQYYTNKGWLGPYNTTIDGPFLELGSGAPDGYGYLTDIKAVIENVPSSVSGIGIECYDGSSWSDRYYWSLKKSAQLTSPGTPTVSYADNTFSLSWSAASGSNGSGNVTYRVMYGDSINGSTAFSTAWSTSTSASIARWINPTWENITYSFYIQAKYSEITRASSTTTYTLTAPNVTWTNKALNITQQGDQVFISWNPASIINNYSSEVVWYSIQCTIDGVGFVDGQYFGADTTDTSILFTPPAYDKELFVQLNAWAHNVSGGVYSDSATFIITSAPEHYTIKCFIDGEWKECIIKYYDGQNWIDSIAKYFDGTQWVECSF